MTEKIKKEKEKMTRKKENKTPYVWEVRMAEAVKDLHACGGSLDSYTNWLKKTGLIYKMGRDNEGLTSNECLKIVNELESRIAIAKAEKKNQKF